MKRKGTVRPGLSLLGGGRARLPASPDEARLEAFPNRNPKRGYAVRFDCPEFTALCPVTGQPDFGRIEIDYVPRRLCLESKSLKLYLCSFRNQNSFNEDIVNRILDDIVRAIRPERIRVVGTFAPRGGISIRVEARHPAIGRQAGDIWTERG